MINIYKYMNLLVLIFLSTGAAAQSIGIQNNPAFLNQEMSMEARVAGSPWNKKLSCLIIVARQWLLMAFLSGQINGTNVYMG